MHYTEFASRRRRLGISQADLAARLGVAPNTVARWERGERAIPNHLQLAMQYLDAELEAERTPETIAADNERIHREGREAAKREWETLSEEDRQAARAWFGDIPE